MYAKLDAVVSLFSKYIESSHSGTDKDDMYVKSEWNTIRNLLEERPVKFNNVQTYLSRLDDKTALKEYYTAQQNSKSKSPQPRNSDGELNKTKVLDEIRRLVNLAKLHNNRLFKN